MPCTACSKGSRGVGIPTIVSDILTPPDKNIWGPAFWQSLHIFAEHIGRLENYLVQIDQARLFEQILGLLPKVIPCPECQQHSALYLQQNARDWQKLRNEELRAAVRTYLWKFHNTVRAQVGQPIIINSPEECQSIYASFQYSDAIANKIKDNVSSGIRLGTVKLDNWKRWFILFNQLRILSGVR